MRNSLILLLGAVTAGLVYAESPPEAKSPEELVRRVAEAAQKKDLKAVKHYLTDESREYLSAMEEVVDLMHRYQTELQNRFGQDPKAGESPTKEELCRSFDLRLKESKAEGDRANLRLSGAADAGRTVRTFAVRGKDGWRLFLGTLPLKLKDREVDLGIEETRLKDRTKEARELHRRLEKHLEAVKAGRFKSRPEAEKAFRANVLPDSSGRKGDRPREK
jgi:hypothetical protein